MKVRLLLLTTILITLCAATAAPAAAAPAPSSSLTPLRVMSGGLITLEASGFTAYEAVSSWASSARGNVFATSGTWADAAGTITLGVQVGRFWELGWWALTVQGVTSGNQAIRTFEVMAAPPSATDLDASATSVAAGGTITFHGVGFLDTEGISVWTTSPRGIATAFATRPYSGHGEVSFSYTVPIGAQAGRWWMTVYGRSSTTLLIGSFIVTR